MAEDSIRRLPSEPDFRTGDTSPGYVFYNLKCYRLTRQRLNTPPSSALATSQTEFGALEIYEFKR